MTIELQVPVEPEEEQAKLASGLHGEIAVNLSGYIWSFLRQKRTGRLFDSSTSFLIDPALPKKEPDLAFVKLERLPQSIDEVVPLAPDLAVEIISGSDDWKDLILKAVAYLQAGVSLVWVIDPYTQAVFVFNPQTGAAFQTLRGEEELDGATVLSGFKLKIKDIFEGITPVLTLNQMGQAG